MAKYTRPNLSSHSVDLAKGFFKILATMSETFVFIYIGTSMCLERQVRRGTRPLILAAVSISASPLSHLYAFLMTLR